MNILQILLAQIPEAIYFSLFMIFVKQLKEKRILFIILMIAEYIIIQSLIHYSIWLQIIYTAFVFIILKLLYKEKAQITDIFTFTISSVALIIVDIIVYFTLGLFIKDYMILTIIDRILLFVILFISRNKLPKIQKLYKKLWNRNDKEKKHIKSTTFRCINIILFNASFYILNLLMLFCIYKNTMN